MSTHSKKNQAAPRFGSRLEDGHAHTRDHVTWSRRDFLTGLSTSLMGACTIGGLPIKAFAQTPLLQRLQEIETDRVLVLIQLGGGNDGLNTVVPYENDTYYQQRPNLAIPKETAQAMPVGMDMGFHPSLASFGTYFSEGKLALLQNVGYPDPNLSHFRSTDIWLSGSASNTVVPTGWLGRHLDLEYPDFEENRPDYPLAVQIGGVSSLLFRGPNANMGMSLINADFFERLAEDGTLYSLEGIPNTPFGEEMGFVRTIANDAFQYAGAVQEASQAGVNTATYPGGNPLSQSLSIVARLIKGRLGARIYHVSLTGFDTHANQANTHSNLLRYLSEGIQALLEDVEETDQAKDVMIMTFSEFGRRVGQNGSFGTDHGTAAPLFVIGDGVQGGLYGEAPNLTDLDAAGNLKHDIHFRTVYATVLQDWFGIPPSDIEQALLGHRYTSLGFVMEPGGPVSVEKPEQPYLIELDQNFPNPVEQTTSIAYTLSESGPVSLDVFDIQGRRIETLVSGTQPAGRHEVSFDAARLPAGMYLYRLVSTFGSRSRRMIVR